MSNKPLNDAALAELRAIYAGDVVDPDARRRLARNPELALIGQDKQAILARHQNDYKMFSLTGLSSKELRAILAALPEYRKDQRVQLEFRDRLEELIESVGRREGDTKPKPKPKPAPAPAPAPVPPPPPPSGMWSRGMLDMAWQGNVVTWGRGPGCCRLAARTRGIDAVCHGRGRHRRHG
jgi:hypothetical protein